MRAAYICMDPGVPVWGNKGCSIHVQGMLKALVCKGIDVDLVALKLGGKCPPGLEQVAVHSVDGELPAEPRQREHRLCELNEVVRQLLGTLGPFDFVYERYALFADEGVEFARCQGIPGLLEVNAPLVEEQKKYRVLVDRDTAVELTERAFSAATTVLAVSDRVAYHVGQHGVPEDRILVLPNAVDPDGFGSGRPTAGATPHDAFTIGFVGSLKPWHGVSQLISAYAALWDHGGGWRLTIVGDGPERDGLRAQAAALPKPIASTVEFVGAVPHAAIPGMLSTMNAGVAPYDPTSDVYFSPLKLFEYMVTWVPVVAARVGQIASIVIDGVTGLTYEPGDIGGLVSALRHLRADPELAAQMAERARREVLAHHTWDHRCDTILQIVRRRSPSPVSVAT